MVIRKTLKKNTPNVYRYTIKKTVKILDTKDGYFVLKKRNQNRDSKEDLANIYDYLQSRSFSYFPKLIDRNDDYDIYEYIDEVDTPREQKALDLIRLASLLHSKTTYFKEVDIDTYKEIYEDLKTKIQSMFHYYNGLMNLIDKDTYMSPRDYLLARNSSKIFASLDYCNRMLENWYNLIKDCRRQRIVTLHNHLEIDHLLERERPYLISWNHTKKDMPIYDIYHFYKKHCLEFEFKDLFQIYEKEYPFMNEEKLLLCVLLSLPDKIVFTNSMYEDCKRINRLLEYVCKTEELVKPYTPKY